MVWILLGVVLLPVIVAAIFSNQKLLNPLLDFLQRITKKTITREAYKFSYKWLFILSLVTLTQFIIAGFTIFLIGQGLSQLPIHLIFIFAGAYAAAWILGYISLFAPGGLGVQELTMAGLLSLFMPFPLASFVAILFRFFLTIGEFIVLIFVFLQQEKRKGHSFPFLHIKR
jgi:uncharacterized membrane protein YbhN (UPF0104 family)